MILRNYSPSRKTKTETNDISDVLKFSLSPEKGNGITVSFKWLGICNNLRMPYGGY